MGLRSKLATWLDPQRGAESGEMVRARERLQTARLNRMASVLEQRPKFLMESAQPGILGDDDSTPFFDPYAYQTIDAIDEGTFREMQRRCYLLSVTDPLVSGWLRLFVDHIVGDKFQLHSRDHDPRTQEVWDEQAQNMAGDEPGVKPFPFPLFARDLTMQTLRYGEDFQREYRKALSGQLAYRIMEPI